MNKKNNEKILFLTGKLAQKRLERILKEMEPVEFTYEIRNIGVSVAALMTAQMIARRLTDTDDIDRIIVPGLCRGDLSKLSEEIGTTCTRGTIDMKDLPIFFGRDCKPVDLSKHDVDIFAEIVDAPMISIEEILARAESYRLGISDKLASEMGHLDQSSKGGIMEALSNLQKPRKILIHINNTNPILDEDSPEREKLNEVGIEVSFDGMEIEI